MEDNSRDLDKELKIKEIKDKIAYLQTKLKMMNDQIQKGLISDQILELRREIGRLESKALDRVKRVDIIDAPPIADRLAIESKKSRSGVPYGTRTRVKLD